MIINNSTYIVGEQVILIPYKKDHVLKYHGWMQSAELQQLTASEPLTLEQEFEMQQTWRNSEDKCTFIVLDKAKFEENHDEIYAMIGDTNLFLNDVNSNKAEAEVMIAENWARGQKRGWESMLLMLQYGCDTLLINEYEVKIGMENEKSLKMFKKIGFEEIGRSEVFKEVTLHKVVDSQFLSWLRMQTQKSEIKSSL